MTRIRVVHSYYGSYTKPWVEDGYAAIGWINDKDLSKVKTRKEMEDFYREANPQDADRRVSANVGMICLFMLNTQPGDYIIAPASDKKMLYYGKVLDEPYYYLPGGDDKCPFAHRRRVAWAAEPLHRSELSVSFQQTMKAAKTLFNVQYVEEFLSLIGIAAESGTTTCVVGSVTPPPPVDLYKRVIDQILTLTPDEFEELVGELLRALGFEETEVTQKSNDGGIDVTGELSISNLAEIKLSVQVKRYKDGAINEKAIRDFRGAIPNDVQGAFITTSRFSKKAREIAEMPGFKHIGLIDGHQLVDLLTEHWDSISEDFRENLGLKKVSVLEATS